MTSRQAAGVVTLWAGPTAPAPASRGYLSQAAEIVTSAPLAAILSLRIAALGLVQAHGQSL